MKRCFWVNLENPTYVKYHDEEWSQPCHDEHRLYELLILESFQAGLSWECVLNKRENFRKAYDNFNLDKIACYDNNKIAELLSNPGIVRNRLKIKASVKNSIIFKQIQQELGSFEHYIWEFTEGKVINEACDLKTTNELSDRISKDLKKRGMTFVGSTIIYSYLQAVGIINAHTKECFCYHD